MPAETLPSTAVSLIKYCEQSCVGICCVAAPGPTQQGSRHTTSGQQRKIEGNTERAAEDIYIYRESSGGYPPASFMRSPAALGWGGGGGGL